MLLKHNILFNELQILVCDVITRHELMRKRPLTLSCLLQDDCAPVNEAGHRRKSPQGDPGESCQRDTTVVAQTLQDESRLPVRIHVATLGIRQLHTARSQVLQSKHHGLHRSQKQVSVQFGSLRLASIQRPVIISSGKKRSIAILDFPSCVIGDQPELTAESMEIGTNLPYSWRNLFSCVNLLRILNKLTKWKHSRIMVSCQREQEGRVTRR